MRNLMKIVLLLLALSFVGAGIPFYTDTIDLDMELSPPDSTDDDQIILSHELNQLTGSEYEIIVWATLSEEQADEISAQDQLFLIQLFSGEIMVADLTNLTQSRTVTETNGDAGEWLYEETLLLAQSDLDLPDGQYRLQIAPQSSQNLFNETMNISDIPIVFSSITDYYPAQYSVPAGMSSLRLFFPDESSRYLIPITRFVPQTNTTLRETVTQLEQGPHPNLGLFNRSPIPPVPRIQLSGGTASLYLSSQLGFYNEYPNVARMAASSLVESLGSIPEVARIQFYFDNRIIAEGFRDFATDSPIEPAAPPFRYAVYQSSGNRSLLFPRSLAQPLISVPDLYQSLVFDPATDEYGYEVQPAVPIEVKLLDYTLEDGVLHLNLSSDFN